MSTSQGVTATQKAGDQVIYTENGKTFAKSLVICNRCQQLMYFRGKDEATGKWDLRNPDHTVHVEPTKDQKQKWIPRLKRTVTAVVCTPNGSFTVMADIPDDKNLLEAAMEIKKVALAIA